MDQHSCPTLVEVKRGDNREGRRSVVGQMLDYASAAGAAWSDDAMRVAFEEDAVDRGADPDEELRALLGLAHDADIEKEGKDFWERAAANLEAGRMRLLFVSDKIPVELERSVTFWNVQTKESIEVLAVEVKQYPNQIGDALVSRVIGQAGSNLNPRRQDALRDSIREEVLGRCTPAGRSALVSIVDTVQKAGAYVAWGKNGLTISKYSSLSGRWPYVARFNWWSDDDDTPLALVMRRPEIYPLPMELRAVLQAWIDKFNGDDFVVQFTRFPRYDIGWAVTEKDLVENVDLIIGRMVDTLTEISAL